MCRSIPGAPERLGRAPAPAGSSPWNANGAAAGTPEVRDLEAAPRGLPRHSAREFAGQSGSGLFFVSGASQMMIMPPRYTRVMTAPAWA